MRNKLSNKYQDFVTDSEREGFCAKLQEVEDWLYEDGEDETKGVYIAKLEELRKQGDPIEVRHKEHSERSLMVDQLAHYISYSREAVLSSDPMYDHIDTTEKQKVLNQCVEVEAWLRETKKQQETLPKHAAPILLLEDMRKKGEALQG